MTGLETYLALGLPFAVLRQQIRQYLAEPGIGEGDVVGKLLGFFVYVVAWPLFAGAVVWRFVSQWRLPSR